MAVFAVSLYEMVSDRLWVSAEQTLTSDLDKEWRHLQLHSGEIFVGSPSHGAEIYLQILRDGAIVFDSVPKSLKEASGTSLSPLWNDKIMRNFHGHINGKRFELVGYFDLHSTLKYLSELKSALLRRCLLMLLLLGPFSWFLAKVLLRPFQRLSRNTLELNSKTLSFRFSDPRTKDEYGILVNSFNNLLERLESSFHQLRRFSGNVSHELRTPLTVIRGEAEWLLRRSRDVSEYEEGLKKIVSRADGIQRVIARLLFLADLERSQLGLSVTAIQVNTRVAEILQALEKIHSAHVRSVEVSKEEARFVGSSDIFSSIATNLLENAFKYSKTRVAITFRNEGGGLRLQVEDDGPGIPTDKRSHVFEPFFKLRPVSERPGTESHGLGLSIVKACVEAMSGKIELEDSKWGGLLVRVWFPQAV